MPDNGRGLEIPGSGEMNAHSKLKKLLEAANEAPKIVSDSNNLDAAGELLYVDTSEDPPIINLLDENGNVNDHDGIPIESPKEIINEIGPEGNTEEPSGEGLPVPVYDNKNDVPNLSTGEIVFVDGEGLFVEDGT